MILVRIPYVLQSLNLCVFKFLTNYYVMTKLVLYHTCTCSQHICFNVLSRKEKAQFLGIFICAQSGFIQGFIFLCVSLGWDGGGGSLLRLVKRLYRCLPFNFLCRIIVSSFFVWRWVFFWEISVRCEIICHSLSTMHVIMYIILDHSRHKAHISFVCNCEQNMSTFNHCFQQ